MTSLGPAGERLQASLPPVVNVNNASPVLNLSHRAKRPTAVHLPGLTHTRKGRPQRAQADICVTVCSRDKMAERQYQLKFDGSNAAAVDAYLEYHRYEHCFDV